MSNPFDDHGDDETGREIAAEIERLERERRERQRLELERLQAEQPEQEDAEFHDDHDTVTLPPFLADTPERLRLGDDDERLPWLESDDDYADDSVDTKRIAIFGLVGLLAIVALIGLAWWALRDNPDAELQADGSTIQAPSEPFRARPADAGGIAADGTGDVSYEVGEGQDRETQLAASPPPPAPTASASAASTQPSIDRDQAADTGGVGVQVGAYSSRATAEAGWVQLTGQHEVLAGVSHRIVQAQVDGNTVYRLQAVSGTVAAGETLCRAIKSGGGDCRVAN